MISFMGKKILMTYADSHFGRELFIKLDKLGAKVVLVGQNEEVLKRIISLSNENYHMYECYDFNNDERLDDLIGKLVRYDSAKFDGYIHYGLINKPCMTYTDDFNDNEKFFRINTHLYLTIIKLLSKNSYANENMSIVLISSNFRKSFLEKELLCVASNYAITNLSKILSLKYFDRKTRVNTVIIDDLKVNEDNIGHISIPYVEQISNTVIYLMSDSAKYIVGEEYRFDN